MTPTDGQFGVMTSDGSWTGLIGQTMNNVSYTLYSDFLNIMVHSLIGLMR